MKLKLLLILLPILLTPFAYLKNMLSIAYTWIYDY